MDDLIKRKDAIKAIKDLPNCYNGFSDTYDKACIIGTLEEVPSTKKAQWKTDREDESRHYCSNCNQANNWGEVPFCPWCGSDMRGNEE